MKIYRVFFLFAFAFLFFAIGLDAQGSSFSRKDSLRGALRIERTCYDVHFYELDIRLDPVKRHLGGQVTMAFELLHHSEFLQIDLFENMHIDRIEWRGAALDFHREYNAVFVDIKALQPGQHEMNIRYGGEVTRGRVLPWDGGFLWTTDREGNPWITVACEGTGASLWWPNKDHLSDEPDSMIIRCTVPDSLFCVSNGSFLGSFPAENGMKRYDWKVHYPINNYNVTVNVGKYAHFTDTFIMETGEALALDFYVMPYNLNKAKVHFKQVHDVLAALEYYFGPYPFPKDGYALVETPYLGMEHQGAIAYGNKYMRGYLGGRQPADMDQDYIILHETGHEYFGNLISCRDHAEMWIHESFTTYLESLFVEYHMSKEDALRYLLYQRPYIKNSSPMLGPLHVNFDDWGHSDVYYKGAWMLQTLRAGLNNDPLWFDILKSMTSEFAYKTISSDDMIQYISKKSRRDWTAFFEHYLRHAGLPVLLMKKIDDATTALKWDSPVPGFDLPLHWSSESGFHSAYPGTDTWTHVPTASLGEEAMEELVSRYLIKVKSE